MRRLLLLGACAAMVLSFATMTSAQAADNATCKLNGTAQFTPGLKTAKQAVHYTFSGKATNCNSTIKNLKSGSIAWNTGQVSSFSFTTSGAGAVVTVKGTVTSGAFAGRKLTAVLAFVANPAQCNGAGVTSAPFNGAFRGA